MIAATVLQTAPADSAAAEQPGPNWRQPWLEPWRDIGQAVQGRVEDGAALHEALNRVHANRLAPGEAPVVRFVAQSELPVTEAYEAYIFRSGNCPVLPGLHDYFNGLCWLRFPRTKTRLNALQAGEIARHGVPAVRGPLRDALTLLDENAALMQAPQALWQALEARDWRALFLDLRPLWAQAQLTLFGHALLEKLTSPRKSITAHVYRVDRAQHSVADLDAWLAGDLNAAKLAAKPFLPLPVLGVPGWCAQNQDSAFYADTAVFRPKQHSRKTRVPTLGVD